MEASIELYRICPNYIALYIGDLSLVTIDIIEALQYYIVQSGFPDATPSGPWQDITMDFIEMPESLGYNYILVIVDRFSKEVVFVPCTKEETAYSTTELFRDHVWCQHGLPSTVVSDCGLVFASNFLGELYKLLGIKGKMSTTFHPQTNGQTERLNHEINQYLRIYIND